MVYLPPSASEAAHYSWRYTKFLLFRVQSPAELYIVVYLDSCGGDVSKSGGKLSIQVGF